MIKQAVLLAAGFGTRMKELTRERPKPMLPLFGKPILEWNILFLKKFGIKEFFINLHYLGDTIVSYFQNGEQLGVQIHYSYEKEIMGTGGAYLAFNEKLDDHFIAMNADIVISLDVTDFIRFHFSHTFDATMAIIPYPTNKSYTPVYYQNNKLVKIGNEEGYNVGYKKGVFTGLHILSKKIFGYLPNKSSSIIQQFYRPALKDGVNLGVYDNVQLWIDLGTKEDYIAFVQKQQNINLLKELGGRNGTASRED